MTWTKFGSEFFDECANAGLSDAAVRTHVEGISWLYGIESRDLVIRQRMIPRFAASPDWPQAVAELVETRFWSTVGAASYRVEHHADVIRQSIAAQQSKRERDRKAQAGARARQRKQAEVNGDVSDDVIGDTVRQTDRQAWKGSPR